MNRAELTEQIRHYTPANEQEAADREVILAFLAENEDAFDADGETDLFAVAVREVKEETGIKKVIPVSREIFSLETLTVDGHEKRGKYVPSHLHLNLTYLMEADDSEPLTVCEDENKGVAWFTLDEALKASTEPWFVKRIYSKLNEKLK